MTVHVCRGVNRRYHIGFRLRGYRHFTFLPKPSLSYEAAILRMARKFGSGNYKRAGVWMSADYYEPILCCEMVRP